MSRSVHALFAAPVGALTLLASAPLAQAQSAEMTVQQFLTIGQNIPRNRAVAMMRPDTRRLIREVTGAVSTVKAEQASAVSAGRTPAHCIPASGTGITPETLVARFETMPEARRRITVTQAVRDWMVERYPCRG
ncbi:MAG: hypothetical protein LKF80_00290 [Brevundimonas sp.]|jgi:hypothetical protein|uniref:hypothetical protein n=1 Tax=Brevundimonas sp. TaxID=1871086 RepID=UPI0025BFD56C|nr:hypothetical protein [Brevundimonas sp.]MCH4266820.1 hypothetical protein [Brevundimonas sp.]